MKHILFGTCCLIFILTACNTSNKNIVEVDENNVITLRIDPMSFYDDQFSDLIEDVYLIQLETTTESLLGEIGKIEIKAEKIFIQDRSLHEIKIFSIDGKYLGKISNQHNGPGGYFGLNSFSVSKNGELIEIYDNRGFKFRIYNLNNEFVEEFPIKYMVSDFINLENDKKLVYSGFSPSYQMDGFPNLSRLLFCNKSDVYQQAFEYVYTESDPIKRMTSSNTIFSYYGDTIVFGPEVASYDIYHIFEDSINKRYQIDFGDKFMLPINVNSSEEGIETFLVANQINDYARIWLVLESKQHLFIEYSLKGIGYYLLFDKSKGKVFNINDTMDLIRGTSIPMPVTIWNDTFVGYHYGEYFKLVFKIYKEHGQVLSPIYSGIDDDIDENSNPVLYFIKYK